MSMTMMQASDKHVLDALPDNSDEQLRIGILVIQKGHRDKVESLEREISRLRLQLKEKGNEIVELKDTISACRFEIEQKTQQLHQATEEKAVDLAEKQSMTAQIRKLNKDLAKLSNFKKAIMKTLDNSGDVAEIPEDSFSSDYNEDSHVQLHNSSSPQKSKDAGATDISRSAQQRTPPRHRYGSHEADAVTAIPKPPAPPSTSAPSSSGSSIGSSSLPSAIGTSAMQTEGREFFKQAKSVLSFEQFNQFLACIRNLNNQELSRDDTLRVVKDIFGQQHEPLYIAFKNLLSRHTD